MESELYSPNILCMDSKRRSYLFVGGLVLLCLVFWLWTPGPGSTSPLTSPTLVTNKTTIPTCGVLDASKIHFASQSREDKAIFEKFFLTPQNMPICHGTFVEIGAMDGKTYSNTLFFEKYLNWTGVLIEGNPALKERLRANRPKSRNFGLTVCKEDENETLFVMNENTAVGGVLDHMDNKHYQTYFKENSYIVKVPCKPMGQILKEAEVHQVDLMSIDVEGSEHVVLQTMDWSIPVKVILIEMGHSAAKDQMNRNYLKKLGFRSTLPDWDITSYCEKGGDCSPNEVFVNHNFPLLAKS